ncbi:MAG: hypothetical protein MAG451_03195 [Anaerolineales bacterium]|nr:hypothetical protein [Anaerolineales bacterium]
MSRSMQEIGEQLVRESGSILQRDVQSALDAEDFNMVVRRAQEVVELALKGALKVLGWIIPRCMTLLLCFPNRCNEREMR